MPGMYNQTGFYKQYFPFNTSGKNKVKKKG